MHRSSISSSVSSRSRGVSLRIGRPSPGEISVRRERRADPLDRVERRRQGQHVDAPGAPALGGDAAQLRAQDEVNAVQGEESVARVREPFARLLDPQRMCEVAGGQQVDALDPGPVRQAVERQAPARAAGERRMDVKVGGVGHAAILSDAAFPSQPGQHRPRQRQTKRRATWDERVFFLCLTPNTTRSPRVAPLLQRRVSRGARDFPPMLVSAPPKD